MRRDGFQAENTLCTFKERDAPIDYTRTEADPGFVERGGAAATASAAGAKPCYRGSGGMPPGKLKKNKNKMLHSGGIVASSFRNRTMHARLKTLFGMSKGGTRAPCAPPPLNPLV